jgi:hypothetical protein
MKKLMIPLVVTGIAVGCSGDVPTGTDGLDHAADPVEPSLAKGGNKGGPEPPYTLTFVFRDLESDLVVGDKRVPWDPTDPTGPTAYTDGQCGVAAQFFGHGAVLSTSADRIGRSEITDCDPSGQYGKEGRVFEVHFPESFGGDGSLDWDGQTVTAKWMEVRFKEGFSLRELPIGQPFARPLWITFVDNNPHPGGNGWGEACPGQLRFDSESPQGATGESATDVQLTRLAYDEWKIEAGSDAVAACQEIIRDEFTTLGFYRLPFQVNVVCRGEC